jgi:hypothetical protein
MDLRRLRPGEWMVGGWGLVLLVSLFLPWYGVGGARGGFTTYAPLASGGNATGWESFTALDVILLLVALAAIAVPIVTASYRVPAVPLALESLVTLVALVAVLLVLFRVLNLPDWAGDRELGVWAALLGTLGIFGSGLVAMRDQRMPMSTRVPIEQMPAPPPEGRP